MSIDYRCDRPAVSLLPRCRELRRRETPAEHALWEILRGRRLDGLKFRRQHQFGPCIIDFFCAAKGLGVEVDGSQHNTPLGRANDEARTAFLEMMGVRVVRFSNDEVLLRPRAVAEQIRIAAQGCCVRASSPRRP